MSRAPGPRGGLITGVWPAFQRDPVGFLSQITEDHGKIVRLRFGPITAHFVNDPDFIAHVLSRHANRYDKNTRSVAQIAKTCGQSLLSSHDAAAAQHRRLVQPLLQPAAVGRFRSVVTQATDEMVLQWRSHSDPVDVVSEMASLTCRIVAKLLFGAKVDATRIEAALAVILDDTWRRIQAPLDLSNLSPRFHKSAFRQALGEIDAIVFDIVRRRRADVQGHDDVLSLLIAAQDDDALTDKGLRDAVMTLLLAGHETTANALAWALWHCGVSSVTAAANPAHILAEALRLYPSIWIIERRARYRDKIGGYTIPKGSYIIMSPYMLHRNADVFPDPEQFDPARFVDPAPRHRYAYLPFGLGQHRCVGLHLAQMIGTTVIAQINAKVRLRPVDPLAAQVNPGMTLQHAGPLFMQVDDA